MTQDHGASDRTRDAAQAPAAGEPAQTARPLWLLLLPMLGRVPAGVDRASLRLLGALGLALLFEHYDASTLGSATTFIRESFGLPQSEVGRLLGWVRFGALPAVFLVPFADRIGRRRLFLWCVAGSSVGSLLTAFAQNLPQFVAAQMLVRSCLVAGSAAAFVIAAEEFPARHRGWAIGVLGALATLGFGLGALLFSAIRVLPFGWRALYVPGVLPLLLLPYFGRRVHETERFVAQRAKAAQRSHLQPFSKLFRDYPGRIFAMSAVALFAAMGQSAAHGPVADYAQTTRGWSPQQYSLLVIVGGAFGFVGNTVLGRLADRIGRRRLGALVLALLPIAAAVVFASDALVLAAAWVVLVFLSTGGNTIVRALAAELFPTSARSTAAGFLTLFETVGGTLGLYLVTLLTPAGQGIASAVQSIVFVTLIASAIVLSLPETARRELEDIAGD